MTTLNTSNLGDRPEWILRLLYAPTRGKTAAPIVGMTRLMKACFLTHKKLESEEGIQTDFKFKPDDYGPLDEDVYTAIEELERRGLVAETESRDYNGSEYKLTKEGIEQADELYDELSSSEQELLSWIKGKHVLQSLSKLLSFVYNQYPSYAEKSKIS